MAEWQFTDAWFATSLAWAGGTGDLPAIIGAADAINHDILTRQQIEQAVRRLSGACLLTVRDGTYNLTRAGRDLLRRRTGRGVAQTQSVLQQLKTVPLLEAEWGITEQEVTAAHHEYINRHRG